MPYGQKADKPRPRIPLVVPVESRYGDRVTDGQLVNAFAEKDEEGEFRVYKRGGVQLFQTMAASGLSPPYTPGGQFVCVSYQSGTAGTVYVVTVIEGFVGPSPFLAIYVNGVFVRNIIVTLLGTLSFCQCSASQIIISNTTSSTIDMYVFNFITGAAALVALSMATGVPGVVALDNTFYAMDINATIWGSDLGSPGVWSATNFIGQQSKSELGIALSSQTNYLVAFKTFSTQLYYDAANPVGSPLLPVPNSTIFWGCLDALSIQVVEDNIYWLATSRQSSPFIAMMSKGHERKISTPGIDRLLDDVVGPFYSFSMKDLGHLWYGLTAVGSNLTIVFDITEDIWYIWADVNGNYWPWFNFVSRPDSTILCQSLNAANVQKIFQFDEEFYQDSNGVSLDTFTTDIYTPNYDSGSRKRDVLKRMDFIADQQPGILKSRWNDNDFDPAKWSQFREVNLNQKRPTLTNNGSFRRRSWHFQWREPLPLRLEAVELDILPGTS